MYDIISSHWHALLFEELNISSIHHTDIIIPIQFKHTHPGPSPFRSQALGAKLRLAGPKWFDQLGQGRCGQRGVGRWWVSPLGKMNPFLTHNFSDGLVQPPTNRWKRWHDDMCFYLIFRENAQTECLCNRDFWVQTNRDIWPRYVCWTWCNWCLFLFSLHFSCRVVVSSVQPLQFFFPQIRIHHRKLLAKNVVGLCHCSVNLKLINIDV